MRLTAEVREKDAARRRALAVVQAAVRRFGVTVVARRVGKHVDTIKRWRDGEGLPASTASAQILKAFPS